MDCNEKKFTVAQNSNTEQRRLEKYFHPMLGGYVLVTVKEQFFMVQNSILENSIITIFFFFEQNYRFFCRKSYVELQLRYATTKERKKKKKKRKATR